MGHSDDSLESTPTWAVAAVCSILIVAALLIEHGLHLLTLYFERRRRKTLHQALYHLKTELRNLGFMSLLLTIANEPVTKICIPRSLADSLLPCKKYIDENLYYEYTSCQKKGKVSLLTIVGTQQLQLLIFVLAVFHVVTCLITFLLADAQLKRWRAWEEKTRNVEFQLSNDPRRFSLTRKTSFGKRHIRLWSVHPLLLWLVCAFRQFIKPVSEADYYALRRGFLRVHFRKDCKYDFQKFLCRSLDHDFAVAVRISGWSWIYAMLMIFFNASEFYNHYWPPFLPLVILLIVGMKLEVIITTMCLKGSHESVIVPGTVSVTPDNSLFWFGRPQFLLNIIHFVLIQNSLHLAYFTWSTYNFGLRSCLYRHIDQVVLIFGVGLLVQFLCAYVTLPLYALVAQMGSTVKESIFADSVSKGLKNWHMLAKKNLEEKRSTCSLSSRSPDHNDYSSVSEENAESIITIERVQELDLDSSSGSEQTKFTAEQKRSNVSSHSVIPSSSFISEETSASSIRMRNGQEFRYPSGRLELLEVASVAEEIIQHRVNNMPYTGEVSFRLWRKQHH